MRCGVRRTERCQARLEQSRTASQRRKSLKKTADDMITRWSHAGWNEEEEGGTTKRANNGICPLQCAELGAFLKRSFVKKPYGK